MAKTIKIEIEAGTGEISVDLNGFHGVGCGAITKAFEELGEVTKDIKKPEFKEKSQVCTVK